MRRVNVSTFTFIFRYLYITILRDPYHRFISEWKHVQRGATWMSAQLKCNGRQATLAEVPFCYEGIYNSGLTCHKNIHYIYFQSSFHTLLNLFYLYRRKLGNCVITGVYGLST